MKFKARLPFPKRDKDGNPMRRVVVFEIEAENQGAAGIAAATIIEKLGRDWTADDLADKFEEV